MFVARSGGRAGTMNVVGSPVSGLAAQTEAADDGGIAFRGGRLEVVQQLATLVHHFQQATAGSMVALVRAEVLAQAVDTRGQQRDLDFRRTGVVGIAGVLGDDSALL